MLGPFALIPKFCMWSTFLSSCIFPHMCVLGQAVELLSICYLQTANNNLQVKKDSPLVEQQRRSRQPVESTCRIILMIKLASMWKACSKICMRRLAAEMYSPCLEESLPRTHRSQNQEFKTDEE